MMIYTCMIIHETLKLHFFEKKKYSWSFHAKKSCKKQFLKVCLLLLCFYLFVCLFGVFLQLFVLFFFFLWPSFDLFRQCQLTGFWLSLASIGILTYICFIFEDLKKASISRLSLLSPEYVLNYPFLFHLQASNISSSPFCFDIINVLLGYGWDE